MATQKNEQKQTAQKCAVIARRATKKITYLLNEELKKPSQYDTTLSVKEQIIKNLIRSATEGNISAVTAMLEFTKFDASR